MALLRAGDERAYEAIFRRHHQPLLSYCRHMLGGRDEAEDALQQAFIRAHAALLGESPPRELRPWLYAIARNCCRTAIAARRAERALDEDATGLDGLADQVARREDLRELVLDVGRLPEQQRSALLLAELEDLSHVEIAEIVGCEVSKVKALVFQARSALLAERAARDASCREIREELAVARGGQLRRGPLRRHLRLCAGCREFQQAVGQQRQALSIVLPVAASAGLAAKVLAHVAVGHTVAAGAALGSAGIFVSGAGTAATAGSVATAGGTAALGTAATAGSVATAGGTAALGTAATAGGVATAGGLATAGGAAGSGAVASAGAAGALGSAAAGGGAAATVGTAATLGTAATVGGAASAGAVATTGVAVGGGLLAKLAVVGSVASLATAGALSVNHLRRASSSHDQPVPAKLASVKRQAERNRLSAAGPTGKSAAVKKAAGTADGANGRDARRLLRQASGSGAAGLQPVKKQRLIAGAGKKSAADQSAVSAVPGTPGAPGRPRQAARKQTQGASGTPAGQRRTQNQGPAVTQPTVTQKERAAAAAKKRAAAAQRRADAAAKKRAAAAQRRADAVAKRRAAAAQRRADAVAKRRAAAAQRRADAAANRQPAAVATTG